MLSPEGRTVIVSLDDTLISGPRGALAEPARLVDGIVSAAPNAVLALCGLLRGFEEALVGVTTIANLTASTIRTQHSRKVLAGTVEQAAVLGAEAIALHVNISSPFEGEMLRMLGTTAARADALGLPVLAIMYPRREGEDPDYETLRHDAADDYAELVVHAARVGVELGADIIKTRYTGSPESFRRVVTACAPVPVVIAGGPLAAPLEALQAASEAVDAGASGVSVGRNVFLRARPGAWVRALKAVVHERRSADDVIEEFALAGGDSESE